ncbi:helix-turn-helix domain-containing protein [Paenibacillus sp. BAC0078]
MYDILLVDDEPAHLSGLSGMLRRLRPEYGIVTARNGREAADKCSARSFQIIITDIRMPLMDGLHFLEQLAPQSSPRRIIYLSGYSHFEYAQKAMSLGSFEYMLKPLDPLKFISVLEKTEKSLEQEYATLHKYERLAVRLDAAEPAYRDRLLNRWLEGDQLAAEDKEEIQSMLGFSGSGSLLVVCTEGGISPDEVVELLRPYGPPAGLASRLEPGLLVMASGVQPDGAMLQRLVQLGLTVGISTPSEHLIDDAARAYAEARYAAKRRFYAQPGEQRVYWAAEGGLDTGRRLASDSRLASMLCEAVTCWDGTARLESAAEGAVSRMLGETAPPMPEELLREVRQLLFQVIYDLEGLREDVRGSLLQQASCFTDDISSYPELIASAAGLMEKIARSLADAKRERKDGVMSRCLDYIDSHYMEDLSQETVAAMFHFSSSYFCQYFKSRLHMTFNQYVTRLRLLKAKELLKGSNVKVYRVAEQLGYHDVKYFNRVFKKETGLTPEEYRSLTRRPDTDL